MKNISDFSLDKRDDSIITLLKEVAILESVNADFEKTNLDLLAKTNGLETNCKSITEEVLIVKTEEERLREEYKLLKRNILYALSRVDLNSVGIKKSSYDFDSLIEMLIIAFKKQKKNYEVVMKELAVAMHGAEFKWKIHLSISRKAKICDNKCRFDIYYQCQ